MIVDAHHHFWNTARNPLPWMTPDHGAIDGIFEPATLAPSLAAHGIDRTVLVQGADLDSDTDYLFELADGVAWVGAVTAWLPLADPSRCRRRLAELVHHSKFRAVRHLIHDEPDPHWIMQPEVLESLALVVESRLILELPVVFPHHFRDTAELAGRFPDLRLVIDHLGKPPIGSDRMDEWEALIRSCASHQNVYAKISGLNTSIEPAGLGRRRLDRPGEGRRRQLRPRSSDVRKRLAGSAAQRRLRPRLGDARRGAGARRARECPSDSR